MLNKAFLSTFWWRFCVVALLFYCSMGVGAFVIGLSKIPSFFSFIQHSKEGLIRHLQI